MAFWNFTRKLIAKFLADDTTTLAASLAFYTSLSLAPLVFLFIAISTELSLNLQHELLNEVHRLVGPNAARVFEWLVVRARETPRPSLANLGGGLVLLVSGSLIFGQLRSALNRIFVVPDAPAATGLWSALRRFIRIRVFQMGWALASLLLLMVALLISTWVSAQLTSTFRVLNFIVSVLFSTLIFALLFRYLPDRRLPLSKALRGGSVTAVLFLIGKKGIGYYLSRSGIGSAYGTAGSVIVLLVWVYYSSLITFIGAEISALQEDASSDNRSLLETDRLPKRRPRRV